MVRPVMKGFHLDVKTVAKLLREAYLRFYLRWGFLKREIDSSLLQILPRILKEAFSAVIYVIKSRLWTLARHGGTPSPIHRL